MELIIGNKNYSSWSLRGWLVLAAFELNFSERKLTLFSEQFSQQLAEVTPEGKVPVLVDGDTVVWDSLAICEYVNERYLAGRGWPEDMASRALARAVSAQMHSGFNALRNEMPMNCRALRKIDFSAAALEDIRKIEDLWLQLREQNAARGPWLFGEFSIADVMYAPVVLRFVTYRPTLAAATHSYMETVLAHPAIQLWQQQALEETDIVEADEAGQPVE